MKRYDNIQILRVFACLGVFISHLAPKMGATGKIAEAANFGASLACATDSGRQKSAGLIFYYLRRALKVLPLYYAVILINFLLHTFILQDVTPDPSGLKWFRYLFLTNAFIPAPDNFWSNLSATWTISLFMVFYICAPFLIRLAGIHSETGEKSFPAGIVRSGMLYAAAILLQQVWIRMEYSAYMMFFYYLHFFMLGIFVWQMVRCFSVWKAAAVLAGTCAVLGILLQVSAGEIPYFTAVSWGFALVMILTMGFSWSRIEMLSGNKKTSGLMEIIINVLKKIFGVLDKHSYAIYLVHAVVIDGIVILKAHLPLNGLMVWIIAVSLTVIGVAAADWMIVRPAEHLAKKLRQRTE